MPKIFMFGEYLFRSRGSVTNYCRPQDPRLLCQKFLCLVNIYSEVGDLLQTTVGLKIPDFYAKNFYVW